MDETPEKKNEKRPLGVGGIGVNWHAPQPVRNEWTDWMGISRLPPPAVLPRKKRKTSHTPQSVFNSDQNTRSASSEAKYPSNVMSSQAQFQQSAIHGSAPLPGHILLPNMIPIQNTMQLQSMIALQNQIQMQNLLQNQMQMSLQIPIQNLMPVQMQYSLHSPMAHSDSYSMIAQNSTNEAYSLPKNESRSSLSNIEQEKNDSQTSFIPIASRPLTQQENDDIERASHDPRKHKRMVRNRESARQSRLKQKFLNQALEDVTTNLDAEISAIKKYQWGLPMNEQNFTREEKKVFSLNGNQNRIQKLRDAGASFSSVYEKMRCEMETSTEERHREIDHFLQNIQSLNGIYMDDALDNYLAVLSQAERENDLDGLVREFSNELCLTEEQKHSIEKIREEVEMEYIKMKILDKIHKGLRNHTQQISGSLTEMHDTLLKVITQAQTTKFITWVYNSDRAKENPHESPQSSSTVEDTNLNQSGSVDNTEDSQNCVFPTPHEVSIDFAKSFSKQTTIEQSEENDSNLKISECPPAGAS